jgi:hypothetical protein
MAKAIFYSILLLVICIAAGAALPKESEGTKKYGFGLVFVGLGGAAAILYFVAPAGSG